MSNNRRGDWMQTHRGVHYYPMDPRPEDVHILDIAHALSHTCRYNGHCQYFYSVAQHSVIVSQHVNPLNARWALMHDAAEAYVGDMIRPMKHGVLKDIFAEIEERNLHAIAERFGLEYPMDEWTRTDVKNHDNQTLVTEARDLFYYTSDWAIVKVVKPYPERIEPLSAMDARELFYARFTELFRTP